MKKIKKVKEFKMKKIKKFKEFIDDLKDKIPLITSPIHFKYVEKEKSIPLTPTPIHFKNIDKETIKEDADNSLQNWIGFNDNTGKYFNTVKNKYEQHDDVAEKHSKNNNFTDEHKKAIFNYTDRSTGLNTHLIKYKKGGHGRYNQTIKHLDSAINNNRLKHDLHVYSGVTFDPEKKVGEVKLMHSPAYISATHSKDTAVSFTPENNRGATQHIIHFHLKAGDPAAHVSKQSSHTHEYETIIKRGVTLRHHGSTELNGSDNSKYKIHHMSIENNE